MFARTINAFAQRAVQRARRRQLVAGNPKPARTVHEREREELTLRDLGQVGAARDVGRSDLESAAAVVGRVRDLRAALGALDVAAERAVVPPHEDV
jgi:hypothetical protein